MVGTNFVTAILVIEMLVMSCPTIIRKNKGVDVDLDSEPELNGVDSSDDDHKYDRTDQVVINSVSEAGPSAQLLFDVTLHLHYSEGVDVALDFDNIHGRDMEKLNMLRDGTKELNLDMIFETTKYVQQALKLWSIKYNREFKVRTSKPIT